jgi:hypothetical protein
MPVDFALTFPFTVVGWKAWRTARRNRSSSEHLQSRTGDWSDSAPVYDYAAASTAAPEMAARFYPNGQLAELRGPAEVVGRTLLGLGELGYRANMAPMAVEWSCEPAPHYDFEPSPVWELAPAHDYEPVPMHEYPPASMYGYEPAAPSTAEPEMSVRPYPSGQPTELLRQVEVLIRALAGFMEVKTTARR